MVHRKKNVRNYSKTGLKQIDPARRQKVFVAVLLAAVCITVAATHWPGLSAHAFSMDDNEYLKGNALIQNPSFSSAWRFITEVLEPSSIRGAYTPVTMISVMLDYAMGGRRENLYPFHRTSLIIHLLNTALVMIFIYQLFGSVAPAAMVALLFGIHPLTVGRIAWVTERKTVLTAFFAMWSLILYVRYTRSRDWKIYGVSLVMYLLALLAKPTSLPLPALMLLLDYWPLRRLSRQAVMEKLPFFAVGAVYFIIAYISFGRTAVIVESEGPQIVRSCLIICHNIIFYLRKIVWPANLSIYYMFPEPFSASHPMVSAGIIGTIILLVVLLVSWRRMRAPIVGWLFFFVAVFPTMGVIGFTDVIAANRFIYLPSLGLLLILGWGLTWLWENRSLKIPLNTQRICIVVLVAVLAVFEIKACRAYAVHWQETEEHFRYMLSLAPKSEKLNYNLGLELARQNRNEEAISYFLKALEIKPDFDMAHNNLGVMLAKRGDLDAAIVRFKTAIQLKPTNVRAHYNLASALRLKGEIKSAIDQYRETLRLRPQDLDALTNLSWILATHKDAKFRNGREAVSLAIQACQLTGFKNPNNLDTLAAAYAENRDFPLAVSTAEKAIDLCRRTGQEKKAKTITGRLQLYKARKPYRTD